MVCELHTHPQAQNSSVLMSHFVASEKRRAWARGMTILPSTRRQSVESSCHRAFEPAQGHPQDNQIEDDKADNKDIRCFVSLYCTIVLYHSIFSMVDGTSALLWHFYCPNRHVGNRQHDTIYDTQKETRHRMMSATCWCVGPTCREDMERYLQK